MDEFKTNICLDSFDWFSLLSYYQSFVCAANQDSKIIPISLTFLVALVSMISAMMAIRNTRVLAQNKNSIDFESTLENSDEYDTYYNQIKDLVDSYITTDVSIDTDAYNI